MAKSIMEMSDKEILENKTNFLLFRNYYKDYCEGYTFEEMGKLFYCICYYEWFREEPNYPDRTTELLFKKIKCDLDANDNDWVTELKIRSLQGSKHKGNQYTRRKENEEKLKKLAEEALSENGTAFQNDNKNGTVFQKQQKNGTNGTDTDTETDTDTDTVNIYCENNNFDDFPEDDVSEEYEGRSDDYYNLSADMPPYDQIPF